MGSKPTQSIVSSCHFVRGSLSAALLLAVSGAGCTDDASGSMMEPGPGEQPDTTAPLVVDSTPGSSENGVEADATIMITFSEPMDRATIESAYSSPQLPLDKVSMSWNPEGTVLTISPDAPMEYAQGNGTDPSAVAPLVYSIQIGADAADLAGNPLGAPLALSFSTKRRMVASFGTDPDLTKALLDGTVLAGASLYAGDSSTGKRYHSYVSFDLSTLPAGSEVELASFTGTQTAPFGAPYNLGAVMAQHLTYASMADIGAVQAMSLPGAFSMDASTVAKTIDVTPQVKDDVLNRAVRADRSQYRLQIDTQTNGNGTADTAVFTKNTFALAVTYVVD